MTSLYSGYAVKFTRRFELNLNLYRTGKISFAELDASVQGWINHVRFADTWGLRNFIFDRHPVGHSRTHQKLQTQQLISSIRSAL
jgi:hypothetical protein